MKRFVSTSLLWLVVVLLAAPLVEAVAQSVKVKTEWMSPGRRSSGPPKYKAPAGPYYIATGLNVVPIGMKAYFSADTTGSGSNVVTSFSWSFVQRPAGSVTAVDSP